MAKAYHFDIFMYLVPTEMLQSLRLGLSPVGGRCKQGHQDSVVNPYIVLCSARSKQQPSIEQPLHKAAETSTIHTPICSRHGHIS